MAVLAYVLIGVAAILLAALFLLLAELRFAVLLLQWDTARAGVFAKVVTEGQSMRSVPFHPKTAAGMNFELLNKSYEIMIQQEEFRRKAAVGLAASLDGLAKWEHEHPQPAPPQYFHRRIAIPLIQKS